MKMNIEKKLNDAYKSFIKDIGGMKEFSLMKCISRQSIYKKMNKLKRNFSNPSLIDVINFGNYFGSIPFIISDKGEYIPYLDNEDSIKYLTRISIFDFPFSYSEKISLLETVAYQKGVEIEYFKSKSEKTVLTNSSLSQIDLNNLFVNNLKRLYLQLAKQIPEMDADNKIRIKKYLNLFDHIIKYEEF